MHRGPAKREIKQERAARTRVEILEAAIILFARRGFLATTMAELAKAIRMTPGALYWHFPTKEDLLLAAIEELHLRYQQAFVGLERGPEGQRLGAREQLLAFFERSHAFLRYHREYGIFFGLVAAESADSNERVAGALRDAISFYVALLASLVRAGQERGELRGDLDPELTAHALTSTYTGLLMHQNLFRDSLPYDSLVSTLDRLLEQGVRSQPPARVSGTHDAVTSRHVAVLPSPPPDRGVDEPAPQSV